MKIGVLTSLCNTIEEKISEVRGLGIDNCQLKCWNSAYFNDDLAKRTTAAAKADGIEITALWCGWDGVAVWNFYEGPLTLGIVPREYRADRVKMLLEASLFAEKIGVCDIITHAGFLPENPSSAEYHEVIAALRYIGKIYKKRGQNFLFETGQETPVTLMRVIEDVGTENMFVNLDPANLLMYGKANAVDSLKIIGKYVRGVHAKDGDYPTGGKSLGLEKALGQGSVNIPELIRGLRECGYNGALTIEREIKGEEQIRDILSGKAFLEKLINE